MAEAPDLEKAAVAYELPGRQELLDSPSTTTLSTPVRVDWSHHHRNPKNWSTFRRWAMVGVLAVAAFVSSLFGTAFEPALPKLMADVGSDSDALASFTISVYVIGYCVGPLVAAPLSEIYGRVPVVFLAYIIFLASLGICGASNNIVLFIVFRAVMGFGAIAFLITGPAVAADIIPKERRGLAMSLLSVGPSVGPTLGPSIGGYISEQLGWRWTFWVGLMGMGLCGVFTALILRETYEPVLLDCFVDRDKDDKKSRSSRDMAREKLKLAWIRPPKIIFRSPVVVAVALYSALTNSYATICFATVGTVFQAQYQFGEGASGLAYFGLTIGFLFGQIAIGGISDRHTRHLEKNGGKTKPENRLPPIFIGAVLCPIGLLWYGWSLEARAHWIVPIIGTSLIAVGIIAVYLPIQIYLVDAFTTYSASVLGASTIIRSFCTGVIPLAANPLYDRYGYGWGNSILAFVAAAFIPIALLLLKYGERIRINPKFQPRL